jgi:hypothetical protein
VLLLNQDVELDPGFLRHALAGLDAHPDVAAVQGRLRRLGGPGDRRDVLDSTGLVMDRSRRVVSRDQGRPDGPQHQVAGPVWGVDGPAPVYRMAALLAARLPGTDGRPEILDTSFFAFKEDVDLAWRLRRLGWHAWYEPAALAWHARGGSLTEFGDRAALRRARALTPAPVKRRSWRNQRLMQVKNDPAGAVLRDLPWILRRELGSLALSVLHDRALLRAIPATVVRLPDAWRKRRALDRLIAGGGAGPRLVPVPDARARPPASPGAGSATPD